MVNISNIFFTENLLQKSNPYPQREREGKGIGILGKGRKFCENCEFCEFFSTEPFLGTTQGI